MQKVREKSYFLAKKGNKTENFAFMLPRVLWKLEVFYWEKKVVQLFDFDSSNPVTKS